jgi:hypothetical protein
VKLSWKEWFNVFDSPELFRSVNQAYKNLDSKFDGTCWTRASRLASSVIHSVKPRNYNKALCVVAQGR